jgi:hypothetical protein
MKRESIDVEYLALREAVRPCNEGRKSSQLSGRQGPAIFEPWVDAKSSELRPLPDKGSSLLMTTVFPSSVSSPKPQTVPFSIPQDGTAYIVPRESVREGRHS